LKTTMSLPDEHIHPYATGPAAKTVDAHQEPQELVFYSGWFCPFNQRSWVALEEKGIPYQYKEVNPYKKEKHFLDINPKGLVPAIEFKSKALYESLIIGEFLEDNYPNTPHLLPSDPYDRARARLWIDHISKSFIPAFFRLLQSQEKEKQNEAKEELYQAAKNISKEVKGPFFLGEKFSLVDIAIAGWVVRDYIVEEHRGYSREKAGQEWVKWANEIEKRDSVIRTLSDREHYTEIYGRYLRDEAQSEAAKATRGGKVIP